jgi:hypothetical protein
MPEKFHLNRYLPDNLNLLRNTLETELGIGIDHGKVKLVGINGEKTIIGTPVVYVCRLSGAPYGHTYLNQNSYAKIKELNSDMRHSVIPSAIQRIPHKAF